MDSAPGAVNAALPTETNSKGNDDHCFMAARLALLSATLDDGSARCLPVC